MMSEIIFQVSEDEIDRGYSASALGYGIHTQAETLEELRWNVREAVDCDFDPGMERPKLIHEIMAKDKSEPPTPRIKECLQ